MVNLKLETILIASLNRGKVKEIEEFLSAHNLTFQGLDRLAILEACPEQGRTFEENARQKAEYYSQVSSLLTLADDSGLVVDALGGEPGIYSARYVRQDASDEERCQAILSRMIRVPEVQRTARFLCVVALARQGVVKAVFEGCVEGVIAHKPSGGNGFGYDPIFYLPVAGKTMAELSAAEKMSVSHRGRALTKLKSAIETPGFLENL